MKAFRRKRIIDERFALTTLQNPTCEVRSREELLANEKNACVTHARENVDTPGRNV